jgi:hypothetical protein
MCKLYATWTHELSFMIIFHVVSVKTVSALLAYSRPVLSTSKLQVQDPGRINEVKRIINEVSTTICGEVASLYREDVRDALAVHEACEPRELSSVRSMVCVMIALCNSTA